MKKRLKAICLDLDGTLADLYSYPEWEVKIRIKNTEPYENCEPLVDMVKFVYLLNRLKQYGIEINIITWGEKSYKKSDTRYGEKLEQAKKRWLEKYGVPYDNFILQEYGTPKSKAIHEDNSSEAVLFDDNSLICRQWEHGRAVNPKYKSLNRELYNLLNECKYGRY